MALLFVLMLTVVVCVPALRSQLTLLKCKAQAFSNLCPRKSPKPKANLSQFSLVSVQNCDKRKERASLFFETGMIAGPLC